MFLFQKLNVTGKISIRSNGKNHKSIEKVKMSKMATVNPVF